MADLTDEAREGLRVMIDKMIAAGYPIDPTSDVYQLDTGAGLVEIDVATGTISNA